MNIKPTHLRACSELLQEGEFENATEAARAVIKKVDELRSDDITYVAVREYKAASGSTYMAYGPYPTMGAARKAAEAGQVGIPGFGALAIVPVKSPQAHDAKLKAIDQFAEHIKGSHWALIREKVGI